MCTTSEEIRIGDEYAHKRIRREECLRCSTMPHLFIFLLQDAASLELMMPFFSSMALFDLRRTQPGCAISNVSVHARIHGDCVSEGCRREAGQGFIS